MFVIIKWKVVINYNDSGLTIDYKLNSITTCIINLLSQKVVHDSLSFFFNCYFIVMGLGDAAESCESITVITIAHYNIRGINSIKDLEVFLAAKVLARALPVILEPLCF